MHRYNMVSWILLILPVVTFALAVPVLIQDKRQAWFNAVYVPEDVVTMLGKRIMDEDLDVLWHNVNVHNVNVLGEPPALPPLNVPVVHAPPPNPAEVQVVPEMNAPPPNPAEVQVPEVHVLPQNPADSDSESMDLYDDAPPASPEWSTVSEDLWRRRAQARRQSGTRTRTVGQRSRMCRARSLGERSWDGVAECS